jgi:dTDP-4-dehydrorhamnose reductase
MIRLAKQSVQPPLPLLITGIAGVAGYASLRFFQAKFGTRACGIRQRDNYKLSGPGIYACDAEDRDTLAALFRSHRFAAVLNCAGNCALKKCELDPAMARRINVDGVNNLLDVIDDQPHQVRLVHLSIDLVYSGRYGGTHVEDHATDPVTVYGQTMVEGEMCIQRRKPDTAILRISLPMGISFNGHAGAIDWIQSRFKKNKPATLYYDEIRTPTYVDCLNRVSEAVLASDLFGLYHAGGPRRLSLFQIAQIVNRVGGYDPRLLTGCYRRQAGPIPPRAGNVSMESSRLAQALGFEPFDPWPLMEEFVPTDPRWHFDRSRNERGSPDLLAAMLYRNPTQA